MNAARINRVHVICGNVASEKRSISTGSCSSSCRTASSDTCRTRVVTAAAQRATQQTCLPAARDLIKVEHGRRAAVEVVQIPHHQERIAVRLLLQHLCVCVFVCVRVRQSDNNNVRAHTHICKTIGDRTTHGTAFLSHATCQHHTPQDTTHALASRTMTISATIRSSSGLRRV
jgi:hypothetical protein